MGLMDRLNAAKRRMWSPMTVWMVDLGSDKLVHAGEPATVVVEVRGEDDGTPERIEVLLQMIGLGREGKINWPLGEVPTVLGRHALAVTIPTELTPSCARFAEYTFEAVLHRSKGVGSTAASRVDIVPRPEDLYWPDGPRSGQDGSDDDVRITVELDAPTVDVGAALTGRATVFALRDAPKKRDVELQFGPTVETLVQVAGKTQPQLRARFKATSELTLADSRPLSAGESLVLPFSLEVPAGVPPTLHNGGVTSVVWKVEVKRGDSAGWSLVGVLDPEAAAGTRETPSPSLASFLAGFDSTP
jgi:hypothetical protein